MNKQFKRFLEASQVKGQTFLEKINYLELTWAFLLTLVFLLTLRLLKLGRHSLNQWISDHPDKIHKPVAYKRLTLISAESVERFVRLTISTLWALFHITTFYVYLSLLFSMFEATRGIANTLFLFTLQILTPFWVAFTSYLPNLFSILLIGLAGYYVLKVLKAGFHAIEDGRLSFEGFYREWAQPTYSLIKFFTILFILVLIFPLLPGFNSPAFKGVSVFLGVLISLGSTSAVANIVAGIVLIYTRAFELGDRIETSGTIGDVVDKSLLVTRIQTIKNVEVTIPNALVLGSMTKNYSKKAKKQGLILNTTVTIGYDVPWRQVHQLLIQAARNTLGILQEPAPFILQTSLDDFFVSYELNAYTAEANKMAILYSELHQNILDCFNQAGVEIMSPHYRALRDGGISTVIPPSPTVQNDPNNSL